MVIPFTALAMVFYFHYEKELSMAKVVVLTKGIPREYIVHKVVCAVPTTTEQKETHPRFVVCGICHKVEELNATLYIS
jgi:hypothetical protein